jgi:hypothetical protein
MDEKEKKASIKTVPVVFRKGTNLEDLPSLAMMARFWEVHSKKVKLVEHVGHTVTVTGSPTNESKSREEKIEAHEMPSITVLLVSPAINLFGINCQL